MPVRVRGVFDDCRGFTLVELLIVIAIVAILSAIAVPFFTKYQERAYDVVLAHDANAAYVAAQVWLVDNPSGTVNNKNKLHTGGYSSSANIVFSSGDMTIYSGTVVMVSTEANDVRNVVTLLFNGRVITSAN